MERRRFNPKRKIRPTTSQTEREKLAQGAQYGGNPEHKKNPGDFNLTPPAAPRPGATLCDAVGIFTREEALTLLRNGIRRGLVSVQLREGWPQNWAVGPNRIPVEAELENAAIGSYHGYPLQEGDPFAEKVIQAWFGGAE